MTARPVTVCFADMVGFTALGERVPPAELASAARRLTELALQAGPAPVTLVKTLGDAVMLVSPEPAPLVYAALRLAARVQELDEGMPPLRVGIAAGDAVHDAGDWFGHPVNLASRVTGLARPASVLVTQPVRDALPDAFRWSFAGRHRLKGVRDEVSLYRARVPAPVAVAA